MADTPEPFTVPGVTRFGDEAAGVGLCYDCRFTRRVESSRGSVFYQCERSRSEPGYRKYPQLPVTRCTGHLVASVISG